MYADSKGSGEYEHLQGSHEPSFLDTAMSTSIKHAGPFDLFFVTSYNLFELICHIPIINRMQLHIYDYVSMWHALYQI